MIKLLHWWRLLTEPSGKHTTFIIAGRWQAAYPDGKKSMPMAYDVACDYAEIYGGKVIRYKSQQGVL
jgi:hypothetical protein